MNEIAQVKRQMRIAEWAREIEECQASGLSIVDWCRQNNIKTKTYYYHLKMVREHSLESIPEELRERIVEEAKAESIVLKKLEVKEPETRTLSPIVIHLKDSIVEVPEGMSAGTLEAVFTALKKYAG